MKMKILTTVSAVALATSAGAMAQTNGGEGYMPDVPAVTEENIKEGWEKTKETASQTAKSATDMIEGTMIEVREALIGQDMAVTGVQFISYSSKHTADNIIGSQVQDANDTLVGNVEDILIGIDGKAHYFVLGDGSVLSFGDKKVAFEYNTLTQKGADGVIVAPITEDLIDKKEPYDPDKHAGISLAKMLDGEVLGADGALMARIDDILLEDGVVTHIIAGFDETLGMGGKAAGVPYGIGTVAVQENETDIVLDDSETANFKIFKSALSE